MNTVEIFEYAVAAVLAVIAMITISIVSAWIYGVDDLNAAETSHEAILVEGGERGAHEAILPKATPAVKQAAPALAVSIVDLSARLTGGDAAAGLALMARCRACHTWDSGGAQRVGPNLWNIVGKEKGTAENYKYSNAMRQAGGTWTFIDLDSFLTNPKEFMPGTKMTFPGIPNAGDRANLLLSLQALSENPVPLP